MNRLEPQPDDVRWAAAGGLWACGVSAVLIVLLIARDAPLGATNLGAVLIAGFGGIAAFAWPSDKRALAIADAALVAATLAGLFSGLGLLFIPALVLVSRPLLKRGARIGRNAGPVILGFGIASLATGLVAGGAQQHWAWPFTWLGITAFLVGAGLVVSARSSSSKSS